MTQRHYLSFVRLGSAAAIATPDSRTAPARFTSTVGMRGERCASPSARHDARPGRRRRAGRGGGQRPRPSARVGGGRGQLVPAPRAARGRPALAVHPGPAGQRRPAAALVRARRPRAAPGRGSDGGAGGRGCRWWRRRSPSCRTSTTPTCGRTSRSRCPTARCPRPCPTTCASTRRRRGRGCWRRAGWRPSTDYLACLVPAFEVGRLTGLGQAGTGAGTLAPAWTYAPSSTEAKVRLPVYDSWSFRTGGAADFESLARAIRPPRRAPEAAQRRFALDPAASAPAGRCRCAVRSAPSSRRRWRASRCRRSWPTPSPSGSTAPPTSPRPAGPAGARQPAVRQHAGGSSAAAADRHPRMARTRQHRPAQPDRRRRRRGRGAAAPGDVRRRRVAAGGPARRGQLPAARRAGRAGRHRPARRPAPADPAGGHPPAARRAGAGPGALQQRHPHGVRDRGDERRAGGRVRGLVPADHAACAARSCAASPPRRRRRAPAVLCEQGQRQEPSPAGRRWTRAP